MPTTFLQTEQEFQDAGAIDDDHQQHRRDVFCRVR